MNQSISYDSILRTINLSIGYKTSKKETLTVLSGMNLEIFRGELVCLIGPNGSGKSTLIRTMSGMQPALAGQVLIDGKQLLAKDAMHNAHILSVVLTDRVNINNLSTFQIASLGRHPHTNWLGVLTEHDKQIINTALSDVGIFNLKDRLFSSLSDGEKQRAMVAKALAQDTPLILLDEPTAHLDLPNRVEMMRLLRNLARTRNKSILLSTHELDLALQAADRIWLMTPQEGIEAGTPEDLVLNGSFQRAFVNQSFDFDMATGTFRIAYTTNKKIKLSGDCIRTFWTKRALQRHGYMITDETGGTEVIVSNEFWQVVQPKKEPVICNTIIEVLMALVIK